MISLPFCSEGSWFIDHIMVACRRSTCRLDVDRSLPARMQYGPDVGEGMPTTLRTRAAKRHDATMMSRAARSSSLDGSSHQNQSGRKIPQPCCCTRTYAPCSRAISSCTRPVFIPRSASWVDRLVELGFWEMGLEVLRRCA
jgi:hypothetical protein